LIRRFPLDAGVGGSRAAGPFDELAALGTAVAQCVLGRPAVYRLPAALPLLHLGETRFHAPTELRRMTRAAAALLERTLPLATQEAAARRVNAEAMLARLPPDSRARRRHRIPGGLAGFAEPLRARRLGVEIGRAHV